MGFAKREYEELQERCIVDMTRDFYEQHEEILKPNTVIKATYLEGERYNKDKEWCSLFEEYKDSRNKLRDKEAELRAINKLKK